MTWLADLVRDFRYSARSLARTPGFTVVAVAVLALGIGATSAIFSLVSAVWLKPLPFADADRIVSLWVDLTAIGGPPRVDFAPGHYADWQERAQSFESMSADRSRQLEFDGRRRRARTARPACARSSSLFETIGLRRCSAARSLPDDGRASAVVVSEGFWLRRLGGDPAAVGRTITLDGSPHLVVGVVPRDFRFPQGESDVFVPTVFAPEVLANAQVVRLVSRREAEPGVTARSRARRDERHFRGARSRDYPQTGRGAAARSRAARASTLSPTYGRRCRATRRRRARAADCVRQRREPDARARDGAAEGARDSQGARRRARPRVAAAA